jgi:hypothetical protein
VTPLRVMEQRPKCRVQISTPVERVTTLTRQSQFQRRGCHPSPSGKVGLHRYCLSMRTVLKYGPLMVGIAGLIAISIEKHATIPLGPGYSPEEYGVELVNGGCGVINGYFFILLCAAIC